MFAVLVSLGGCGMSPGGEQYPLPSGVQSVDRDNSIEITPNLHIDAGRDGPAAHINDKYSVPIKNRVQVWDSGKLCTIECLGLRRDIENKDGPVFAVRVRSQEAPAPVIAANKSASGTFAWEDGHPTNITTRGSETIYSVVSHDPLLAVGMDDSGRATVVTNFGISEIDAAELYKITEVKGSTTAKVETDIGPAHVTLARMQPSGKTSASITVSDPTSYKGTIICDIETPDRYSSALGMATYINPNSPQPPDLSAFQKPDPSFAKSWELQLDPPIKSERGTSPNASTTEGPAHLHAMLWKLGDRIYGYSGYNFSGTSTPAGGRVEGTLQDGKLTLRVMGEPNMKLESTWVGADEISGNASVWGYPAGASSSPPERYHKFKLIKKNDDEGREEDKLCAEIDMLPPNLEYWDAITCAPSESYRTSLVAETVRLMRDDQTAGQESKNSLNAASSLAHTQYTAWLSSRNFWGENHPITQANKRIAETLYKRVLRSDPLDYEYAMEDYIKMLTQAHDEKGAKVVRTALNKAKAANLD